MVVAIPKEAGGVFASGDNLVAGVGKGWVGGTLVQVLVVKIT